MSRRRRGWRYWSDGSTFFVVLTVIVVLTFSVMLMLALTAG